MFEHLEEPVVIELKATPAGLGHSSIVTIQKSLDRLFGSGAWHDYEIETISVALGIQLDELTMDKINLLKVIHAHPHLFFEDPSFMLHATEVLNNNVADFDTVPAPTSLELAFAIEEIKRLAVYNEFAVMFEEPIKLAVAYLLRKEGYSEPIGPFNFIPAAYLVKGQTAEDTNDKLQAINHYLSEMTT